MCQCFSILCHVLLYFYHAILKHKEELWVLFISYCNNIDDNYSNYLCHVFILFDL